MKLIIENYETNNIFNKSHENATENAFFLNSQLKLWNYKMMIMRFMQNKNEIHKSQTMNSFFRRNDDQKNWFT